jgi:hypothetical protein
MRDHPCCEATDSRLTDDTDNGEAFVNCAIGRPYPAPVGKLEFSIVAGSNVAGANAESTSDYLQGGSVGASGFVPTANPFVGVGGGINHSYTGGWALESAIGTTGAGVTPIGHGHKLGE